MGLAISDELGITAQGLPTIHRKNNRTDLAELSRIVRERAVELTLAARLVRDVVDEAHREAVVVRVGAEQLRLVHDMVLRPPLALPVNGLEALGCAIAARWSGRFDTHCVLGEEGIEAFPALAFLAQLDVLLRDFVCAHGLPLGWSANERQMLRWVIE